MIVAGMPFGQFFSSLAGIAFLDGFGWRFLYLLSFFGLALLPPVYLFLPESMKFYIDRDDGPRVRLFLGRAAPGFGLSPDDVFEMAPAHRADPSMGALFSRKYIRNTAALSLAFFCNLYVFYGVSTWLPGLMAAQGYALRSSLAFLSAFLIGNVLTAAVAGLYADGVGYRKMLGFFYVTLAVTIALLSIGFGGLAPYILVFIAGGCVGVGQNMALAITPRFYPIALRGTVIGLCSACSRVGSGVAPVVIGLMLSLHMQLNLIFLSFVVPALFGLAAVLSTREPREPGE
jgi:AAHS family benzoate transporter-like MFS transporter